MVTLTNRTNRHIEIEDKDGVALIINSKQTSKPLDEKKFTPRTERLIKEVKLIKKEIPVAKPEPVVETPVEVVATDDTKSTTKTTKGRK